LTGCVAGEVVGKIDSKMGRWEGASDVGLGAGPTVDWGCRVEGISVEGCRVGEAELAYTVEGNSEEGAKVAGTSVLAEAVGEMVSPKVVGEKVWGADVGAELGTNVTG
jgi:hypothetical protein